MQSRPLRRMGVPVLFGMGLITSTVVVAQVEARPAVSKPPRIAFVATSYPGFIARPACMGTEVLGSGRVYRFRRPAGSSHCLAFRPIPHRVGFIPREGVRSLLGLAYGKGFFAMPRTIGGLVPDMGHRALRIKIGKREHTVVSLPKRNRYTHAFDQIYRGIRSLCTSRTACACTG